jgi:type I restriction enzyme S subunit
MSDALPKGWAEVEVGNVLHLINGFAFKPSHWGKTGLPIIRIQNLNNPDASFNYCADALPEKIKVRNGDLLFAWSGTPGTSFGAHIWSGGDAWLNQHIFRVEFDPQVFEKLFLRHAINQNLDHYIAQAHGGAGLAHITKGMFETSTLRIAPLAEQKRIVAKLEKVLEKVDASRARLDKIPMLLKRFRQSVLAAACSGKLTADWRDQRGLDDEWSLVPLRGLCDSFNYGTSAKSQPVGQVPVLRMGNIQDGEIDWTSLVFTSDKDEIRKYTLKPKTVLFNRTNSPELVGKTAIYRGERPAIFAGYLIRINPRENLDPEYLNYCLNTSYAKEYYSQVKTDGVSQSNINAQKLADFELPYCPLPEQQEIVRRVEELFLLADQLEARYAKAKAQVDRLTQSILAKAFRGELVPQDPSDEPASVLLARLRSAPLIKKSKPVSPVSRRKRRVAS